MRAHKLQCSAVSAMLRTSYHGSGETARWACSRSMTVELTEMSMGDYDEVAALWQATEGVCFGHGDGPEDIAAYLRRSEGLSFVARENGTLVGAVLCGHDGRRGYLHHLAVATGHRGRGLGEALAEKCLAALGAMSIEVSRLRLCRQRGRPGVLAGHRLDQASRTETRLEGHRFRRRRRLIPRRRYRAMKTFVGLTAWPSGDRAAMARRLPSASTRAISPASPGGAVARSLQGTA